MSDQLNATMNALHLLSGMGMESETILISSRVTEFQLSKVPGNTPVTLLVNGQIYSEATDDMKVDRTTRTVTWLRTAVNGGVDLKPPGVTSVTAYYVLTDDQGLNALLTTVSGYTKNITAEASLIQDMRQTTAVHTVQLRALLSEVVAMRTALLTATGIHAWAYDKEGHLHPRLFNDEQDYKPAITLKPSGTFRMTDEEDYEALIDPVDDNVFTVLPNGDIQLRNDPMEDLLWKIETSSDAYGDVSPHSEAERTGYLSETVGGCNCVCTTGNAGAHNLGYRGQNITEKLLDGTLSVAVAGGAFTEVYPGDFVVWPITVEDVTYESMVWVVMGCNTFMNQGDQPMKLNHIVFMPMGCLGLASPGAGCKKFTDSDLWMHALPAISMGIIAAFGEGHVLAHREMVDNKWTTVTANLPTGIMMCGPAAAPLELGTGASGTQQLPACVANPAMGFVQGQTTWTRSATATGLMVVDNKVEISGAGFVAVDGYTGAPTRLSATATAGLRPYFLYR